MTSPARPTVLVTGGGGYIGSHAVLALREAGREVVVLDNLSTGFRWAVAPDVPFAVGDVADAALLDRLIAEHAVGAILHFAGSVVVPESVADPLKYYHNNTAASRTLIERAIAGEVRHFIFSSTAAVYGAAVGATVEEIAPTVPINPYGRSKLMTEMMLEDASAAHGLKAGVLRYFNVAGADPAGRAGQSTRGATHLIKVGVEAALGKRESVTVFGDDFATTDGTGVRDYIHVSDLAAAHVAALEALEEEGAGGFTLNCGYGRGYSVLQVLDAVDRAAGVPLDRRQGPRRPGDPATLIADNKRILERLAWRPARDDLDIIVADALRWERGLEARRQSVGRSPSAPVAGSPDA